MGKFLLTRSVFHNHDKQMGGDDRRRTLWNPLYCCSYLFDVHYDGRYKTSTRAREIPWQPIFQPHVAALGTIARALEPSIDQWL